MYLSLYLSLSYTHARTELPILRRSYTGADPLAACSAQRALNDNTRTITSNHAGSSIPECPLLAQSRRLGALGWTDQRRLPERTRYNRTTRATSASLRSSLASTGRLSEFQTAHTRFTIQTREPPIVLY